MRESNEQVDLASKYQDKVLRSALKRALEWYSMKTTARDGMLKDSFTRHLDAVLAVYLSSDKIKPFEREIFNAKYQDRLTEEVIAIKYSKKLKTIRNILYHVLGEIVRHSDSKLIEALIDKPKKWIVKGCQHCHGDLEWEENGVHGEGGEYVCIQCSRRYEFWGRSTIMPWGKNPRGLSLREKLNKPSNIR